MPRLHNIPNTSVVLLSLSLHSLRSARVADWRVLRKNTLTYIHESTFVQLGLAHKGRKPGSIDEPDGRKVSAVRHGEATPAKLCARDKLGRSERHRT